MLALNMINSSKGINRIALVRWHLPNCGFAWLTVATNVLDHRLRLVGLCIKLTGKKHHFGHDESTYYINTVNCIFWNAYDEFAKHLHFKSKTPNVRDGHVLFNHLPTCSMTFCLLSTYPKRSSPRETRQKKFPLKWFPKMYPKNHCPTKHVTQQSDK